MSTQMLEKTVTPMFPLRPVRDRPTRCGQCAASRDAPGLRKRNLELEERVRELDAFARTVAHDIKSPVSSLIGFAITLKDDVGLSAEQRQGCLTHLANITYKLNNIVDELLLLAEMRQADVTLEPLHMASIVAAAQERLAPVIRGYAAEVVLPAAWPLAVGHGPWVEEVWVNYISNAIKYGGATPRVELNAAPQTNGAICFWVRDNGAGIALDDQPKLFKPFARLDHVRARGHGLGLSVVRHIVEKLGGEVGVSSAPGHGSVFSFTLPGCTN